MRVRLSRSSSERMIAGVCGGLAEYFTIDPVIVRLIFVLVTLTSGFGLPIYLLLWMIMPRSMPIPGQRSAEQFSEEISQLGQQLSQEATQLGQQLSQEATQLGQQLSQEASRLREEVLSSQRSSGRRGTAAGGGDPPNYRPDPFVGQPSGQERPMTGKTVNLGPLPTDPPIPYVPPGTARPRSWNKLGVILLGIGGLIFLEQLGINMSLIFPVLMIAAGLILMSRRR